MAEIIGLDWTELEGSNDVNRQVQPSEFLWTLQKTTERMKELATTKNSISILPPPPQEEAAKQQIFKEALNELAPIENITIWDNPIEKTNRQTE